MVFLYLEDNQSSKCWNEDFINLWLQLLQNKKGDPIHHKIFNNELLCNSIQILVVWTNFPCCSNYNRRWLFLVPMFRGQQELQMLKGDFINLWLKLLQKKKVDSNHHKNFNNVLLCNSIQILRWVGLDKHLGL